MASLLIRSVVFAGLLGWAVHHMSGSLLAAAASATLLFAVAVANVLPFATAAVPTVLAAGVLVTLYTGMSPVGHAMTLFRAQAQDLGALIADRGPDLRN